jgi:hypothetical protein
MNPAGLIAALNLPASARVERRVPKKLLLENGAPTPADKRHINDGVEELFWVAALKPTTIGVPEYRDAEREYLEIAVLRFTLRAGAKATRLVELVHRAVPYPVVLLATGGDTIGLSLAHKRWAQNEAEKTVVDGEVVATDWEVGSEAPHLACFRNALALEWQPQGTLRALYQGWMDTLIAFKAARLTGNFEPGADPERATARQEALRECARLETEMARLRAAAGKEKQMARKVELNMDLKRVEAAHASARARL